jgi:hypothetical protein
MEVICGKLISRIPKAKHRTGFKKLGFPAVTVISKNKANRKIVLESSQCII